MQIKRQHVEATRVILTINADTEELANAKHEVLQRFRKQLKLPGFRTGKVPLQLVERNVDHSLLQTEVADAAINRLYGQALETERLRPVARPEVKLTKFVPFTTLQFNVEVEVIGKITLPDYKKWHLAPKELAVSDEDVNNVIHDLQLRGSARKEVNRPAAKGDEVFIDFAGTDAERNAPVRGADGKG